MDQRKIMSLGRSSLVISLPKRWIKLNELERGDLITLQIMKNNSLVAYPGIKKERETLEIALKIDPAEDKGLLTRRIIACYLNGYSGITLVSTDIFTAVQQKAIRNIVGILYMQILESNARRVRIQILIDESKAPVETAIRRMHIVANSMCQDALESLKNQDVELAKVVHGLDDDVDRLCFFLLRLLRASVLNPDLAQKLNLEPIDCLDYQSLVHRIEYVADLAVAIANNVIMAGRRLWLPPSVLESLLNFGNQALGMYNEAFRAFFASDMTASNHVIERLNELEPLNQKIAIDTVDAKDALAVCRICMIRDSIKRIARYAKHIAEYAIDHMYKPKSPSTPRQDDKAKELKS